MTQQEVIKAFMYSLDKTTKKGTVALDEAIKAASNLTFKSFKDLKAALIRDCKNAKSADDFLKTYCGINFDTDDTGAITGSDAGGSKSKTDENIIPESGSLKECNKNSFTVNGLTVKLGDGKTYKQLNADQKFIWNGLYTWWIKGALDLIAESYGDNFSFTNKSSATTKELYIQFVSLDNDWRAYSWGNYNQSSGEITKLTLSINMKYYNGYSKKSIAEANSSFDILIAHELTHSVMDANIIYKNVSESLPAFVKEGLAVLTTGVTDDSIIKSIAANPSEFENGLNLNKTSVGVNDSHFPYEGGFVFFRYLARQMGDLTIENKKASADVKTFYGNDTIKSEGNKVTIVSGAGNDKITNTGASVFINGGDDNDLISNDHASKVTIIGGAGNDTLWNWSTSDKAAVGSNVSIAAGAGNDTVWNDGAKVTITGDAGSDTVSNTGASVSINGGAGEDSLRNYGGSNVTIDGGTDNDFLYNDSIGSNVIMLGGTGDDTIWNWGYNVTIIGGTGNDTIANAISMGKNVVFNYTSGEGNDIITGFNATSTLSISGGTYSTTKSSDGNDVIVTVGDGKVTLSGAASLSKVNIKGSLVSGGKTLTVTNSTKSPVTLSSAYKNADASKRTKAVKIACNALNNSIKGGSGNDSLSGLAGKDTLTGGNGKDTLTGGDDNDLLYGQAGDDKVYGQGGNDSLYGGSGNDSLWGGVGDDLLKGGAGNDWLKGGVGDDTFIYINGDGKDRIVGFDDGDLLQITGAFTTSYNSSKNEIYFKVGSTAKAITLTDFTATTFHVNDDTYQLSGNKFVKR